MADGRGATPFFVGTQGTGLHAARLEETSGTMTLLGLAAEVERPTWLLSDPARAMLYAVSEVGNAGDRIGDVLGFAIDAEAGLRQTSRVASGGGGPTHLAIAPDGGALFVANYGTGSAAVLPIDDDGGLHPVASLQAQSGSGPHRRQQGPHAHGVTLDPSGRFLFVPDMGADRLFVYCVDPATRTLSPAPTSSIAFLAGSGPRLLLFGAAERFAYLLTELSADIHILRWDVETGGLDPLACIPLDAPDVAAGRSAAAFAISRDARFLYASNRRTNAIHVFAIDAETGLPTAIQTIAAGGEKPWAAEFAPGGDWLLVANQGSNSVRLFAIDRATGMLADTDRTLAIPSPTGFAFVRAGVRA